MAASITTTTIVSAVLNRQLVTFLNTKNPTIAIRMQMI